MISSCCTWFFTENLPLRLYNISLSPKLKEKIPFPFELLMYHYIRIKIVPFFTGKDGIVYPVPAFLLAALSVTLSFSCTAAL